MYWIAYYLSKGHRLDYLLNLSWEEEVFFKEAMNKMNEEKVLYDIEKINALIKGIGGGGNIEQSS